MQLRTHFGGHRQSLRGSRVRFVCRPQSRQVSRRGGKSRSCTAAARRSSDTCARECKQSSRPRDLEAEAGRALASSTVTVTVAVRLCPLIDQIMPAVAERSTRFAAPESVDKIACMAVQPALRDGLFIMHRKCVYASDGRDWGRKFRSLAHKSCHI
jgi:hypothetical protein